MKQVDARCTKGNGRKWKEWYLEWALNGSIAESENKHSDAGQQSEQPINGREPRHECFKTIVEFVPRQAVNGHEIERAIERGTAHARANEADEQYRNNGLGGDRGHWRGGRKANCDRRRGSQRPGSSEEVNKCAS